MRKHSHWLTQDFVVCYWRRSEIVAPIKSKVFLSEFNQLLGLVSIETVQKVSCDLTVAV